MKSTPSVTDLFAHGEACRKNITRSGVGDWNAGLRKRDPLTVIADSTTGRLPALLPIKTERMSASPFGFFRGAAPLMAYDLSLTPHTGITTQLCGDAHVENLGAYTGLDGRLTFDINDFDETIRGPFEWDIKRMAVSILLAAQQARVTPSGAQRATRAFLRSYIELITEFSTLPILDVARFQIRRLRNATPISKILRQAERSTPLHSLDHLTEKHSNGRIFRSNPPLLTRITGAKRDPILASVHAYTKTLLPERQHFLAQFHACDVAFKVVGTGSVGMRDYCIYLQGNGPNDPLFLQIKEETRSAYAPYLPASAAPQKHQGQRVAEGQRAMQLQTDPLLGWTRIDGRDFLVRQLNDHKAALDVTTLTPRGLLEYARVCGELLARGHARSGDSRIIAGYLGGGKRFTESILQFAGTYATQTNEDWKTLLASHTKAAPPAHDKH
jgi:uncharacterized protein (DUF2252 family)